MSTRARRAAAGALALGAVAVTLAGAPAAGATLTVTTGRNAGQGHDHVVVAHNDGSHRRTLGAGELSLVSPDGSRVAVLDYVVVHFVTRAVRLKLFRAADGRRTLAMDAGGARPIGWSPDSTKLLATDYAGRRLLVVDAASGMQTTLASGPIAAASFSPDGTKLAYVQYPDRPSASAGALKVLDIATGMTATLRRRVAAGVVFGPERIAFSTVTRRGRRRIYNVASVLPDGTELRRLTHIRSTRLFFGLLPQAFSADGERLLTSTVGNEGYWLNTYGVDAVHGGARLIARHVEPTAFSRDGRFIIGQTGDAECCGYRFTDVVRVPWRGGGKRVLIRHAMGASYSG
ncbi:MAG TPA: hypothetical protein VH683_11335 [Thermoleophilaceae bacterium]|jgi:DNA-binding beta-propeller fold protein YncE